ncbi:TenA family protein [Dietzia aerolata]|uniref:TenA family protein n=1 Tax=Dietzia aerolata TaxID=595984 RepID=UPI00363202E3
MTLFETLKSRCAAEWEAYTRHDFVEQLGAGTLPLPVFQDYLIQDFHFLVQFARANALATYKSRTLADLTAAHAATGAILAETELHLGLTERWGIPRAELEAAPEKQATVAYTRYVLDAGMVGTVLDLSVALAPCTIGYAEIGAALAPRLSDPAAHDASGEHPYAEWISEYSGRRSPPPRTRRSLSSTRSQSVVCPIPGWMSSPRCSARPHDWRPTSGSRRSTQNSWRRFALARSMSSSPRPESTVRRE